MTSSAASTTTTTTTSAGLERDCDHASSVELGLRLTFSPTNPIPATTQTPETTPPPASPNRTSIPPAAASEAVSKPKSTKNTPARMSSEEEEGDECSESESSSSEAEQSDNISPGSSSSEGETSENDDDCDGDENASDSDQSTEPQGPQVTLILRTGEKSLIPEDILCKLPFFALALREGYKETITKTIHMPDDDPVLVQCLLSYLHTSTYPLPPTVQKSTSSLPPKLARMELKLFHTSVLILADKYMCPGLAKLAALNLRKIVLSPMSFVSYMVSVYEMTPPGSPLRIGYFVDYGYKDELLLVHPQWTIASHTRASITRLLEASSTEERFVQALDRCPQLAVDLLKLVSKGKEPVEEAILQCEGAAKAILLNHCRQFYDKRPWTAAAEVVKVPWGWWKG